MKVVNGELIYTEAEQLQQYIHKKVGYTTRRNAWENTGCIRCKYSHENVIMKNGKKKCGKYGIDFSIFNTCKGYEEKKWPKVVNGNYVK